METPLQRNGIPHNHMQTMQRLQLQMRRIRSTLLPTIQEIVTYA